MNKKTICVLPFNTLSIGGLGAQRLCCNANNGGLSGSDRPIPVGNRTDTKWLEGVALDRIRKSMLAGEKIKECDRCWSLEDIGSDSYRMMNNTYRFPDRFDKIIAGDVSLGIERIEIDVGNKCNLACRMCHPGSSSLLAQELANDLPNAYDTFHNIQSFVKSESWIQSSKFFDVVRENARTLKSVYIIGGEPLIIEEQEQLLDLLIELDIAKNIELSYNTNITTLGRKWYDKWDKFKSVAVNASIDGVGEYYEYVRWPAKWEKIYENLKELKRWGVEHQGRHRVAIDSTLSNLTMPSIVSATDLLVRDLGFSIFYINVDHPGCMSPWVLPASVRATSASAAIDHITTNYKENYNLMNTVKTLEKVLTSAEPSDTIKSEFIKRMKFMDKNRKQNLLSVHPWFEEWYNAY